MDKKEALAELIKGLKRVKEDLEELAKAEQVPEETFSQKLRKAQPKVMAPKTDKQIAKPGFKDKLKQVGAALIKEGKEENTDKDDKETVRSRIVSSHYNKKPGTFSVNPSAKDLKGESAKTSDKKNYPKHLQKEASTEESSESSPEGSEQSESSKKDSKSRFKDMLFAMKAKK